jgi:hypothetical protein
MKKLLLIILFSIPVIANETVTIIDKNGDVRICKVVPSGAIVCL